MEFLVLLKRQMKLKRWKDDPYYVNETLLFAMVSFFVCKVRPKQFFAKLENLSKPSALKIRHLLVLYETPQD